MIDAVSRDGALDGAASSGAALSDAASGEKASGGEASGAGRGATTVLIVDDHHAFADLLAAALRSEPGIMVVATADSADSAVQAAVRTRPDVVVMDIQLGGEDGLAAARRIRSVVPNVRVVVVSAHADAGWLARAASAGANGFAPKSGSLSELLSVLRQARAGALLVAPSLRGAPAGRSPVGPGAVALTAREAEVLQLLAGVSGLS